MTFNIVYLISSARFVVHSEVQTVGAVQETVGRHILGIMIGPTLRGDRGHIPNRLKFNLDEMDI